MTSELTRLELIQLFNAETPEKIVRFEAISTEMDIRLKDIDEISERITRGGIQTLAELSSLVEDLENHRGRIKYLMAEVDLMVADHAMDLKAIHQTLD